MWEIKNTKGFHQQLNRSYVYQEKYAGWMEYRKAISSFIDRYAPDYSNCLLLGAGYMNDIDLASLHSNYEGLTCVDVDSIAMQLGLEQQKMGRDPRVHIVEADVSGLPDDFFDEVDGYWERKDFSGLKLYLDGVEQHPKLPVEAVIEYDMVLISALYSQLVFSQIMGLLSQRDGEPAQFESVLRMILDFMPRFLDEFNTRLCELVKANGLIIAWSDILEYRRDDPLVLELTTHIDDTKFVDGVVDHYVSQYGHGISSYGMENLFRRLSVLDSKWLLWPFDPSRVFLVKLNVGRKG